VCGGDREGDGFLQKEIKENACVPAIHDNVQHHVELCQATDTIGTMTMVCLPEERKNGVERGGKQLTTSVTDRLKCIVRQTDPYAAWSTTKLHVPQTLQESSTPGRCVEFKS
jgi:hypothetical protein